MREVLRISDRITILRLGKVVGTVDRAETDGQKLAGLMIGKELTESHYEKVDATGAGGRRRARPCGLSTRRASTAASRDLSLRKSTPERSSASRVSTATARPSWPSSSPAFIAPQTQATVQLKGDRVAVFDPNGFIEHGVSHVPEDRNLQGLIGDMSIAENLVLKDADDRALQPRARSAPQQARHPRLRAGQDGRKIRRPLPPLTSQSVRALSGGNQQKVISRGSWRTIRRCL